MEKYYNKRDLDDRKKQLKDWCDKIYKRLDAPIEEVTGVRSLQINYVGKVDMQEVKNELAALSEVAKYIKSIYPNNDIRITDEQ